MRKNKRNQIWEIESYLNSKLKLNRIFQIWKSKEKMIVRMKQREKGEESKFMMMKVKFKEEMNNKKIRQKKLRQLKMKIKK